MSSGSLHKPVLEKTYPDETRNSLYEPSTPMNPE
jgi:hypothetical protein